MNFDRRRALVALTVAGLLWGSTVPLSKIALGWLPPGWLTAIRFAVAAAVLLAVTPRSRLRAAWSPAVLAWGAAGYGGTVLLQNAGITRTSVSHAALLIGTAPVMVAIIAAVWQRSVARPVAWGGFAVSLAGVGLVAAGGGGGADLAGDGMVLASVLISAVFTVGQTRLLRGRDPIAVTALQFLGAALVTAPFSVLTESMPSAPAHATSLLAVAALIAGGTLLPFTLFAFGQSRLPAEIAGAFLNIEPLVGAVAGVVAFGNPAGPAQLSGGAAILGGIALSSVRRPGRRRARPAVAALAAEALVVEALAVEAPAVEARRGGAGCEAPAVRAPAVAGTIPVAVAAPELAGTSPAGTAPSGTVPLGAAAGGEWQDVLGLRWAPDHLDVLGGHDALYRRRRRCRLPAAGRGCPAAAAPAAQRHSAGFLRPGRGHGTVRSSGAGWRRPRGLVRPGGRRDVHHPGPERPGGRRDVHYPGPERPGGGPPGDGGRGAPRRAGRS